MAIDSYANLKTAITNFTTRTDLSDIIDNLIELTEDEIDTQLKLRNNELRATATASTTDRFLALPTRFLKMRRLSLISGSLNYEIAFKAPEQMTIRDTSGRPRFFTVTSQLEFDRICDSAYTVEMSYFSRLIPLTSANTTNDVLTDYPRLYLYGCLKNLKELYEEDLEAANYYTAIFERALEKANSQERKGRYGAAMRMMPETSTP